MTDFDKPLTLDPNAPIETNLKNIEESFRAVWSRVNELQAKTEIQEAKLVRAEKFLGRKL